MKISRYFANLNSSYQAELDDLCTDSEGNNVLRARLNKKREQVPQLLMMMDSAPEMVAVAFHGGFVFKETKTLEKLVGKERGGLLTWEALKSAVTVEPWAEKLVKTVLTDPHGEHFLATTVGLEFLYKHSPATPLAQDGQDEDDSEDRDQSEDYLNSDDRLDDEGEGTEFDLDKAGADFLAEHGFDRKE